MDPVLVIKLLISHHELPGEIELALYKDQPESLTLPQITLLAALQALSCAHGDS